MATSKDIDVTSEFIDLTLDNLTVKKGVLLKVKDVMKVGRLIVESMATVETKSLVCESLILLENSRLEVLEDVVANEGKLEKASVFKVGGNITVGTIGGHNMPSNVPTFSAPLLTISGGLVSESGMVLTGPCQVEASGVFCKGLAIGYMVELRVDGKMEVSGISIKSSTRISVGDLRCDGPIVSGGSCSIAAKKVWCGSLKMGTVSRLDIQDAFYCRDDTFITSSTLYTAATLDVGGTLTINHSECNINSLKVNSLSAIGTRLVIESDIVSTEIVELINSDLTVGTSLVSGSLVYVINSSLTVQESLSTGLLFTDKGEVKVRGTLSISDVIEGPKLNKGEALMSFPEDRGVVLTNMSDVFVEVDADLCDCVRVGSTSTLRIAGDTKVRGEFTQEEIEGDGPSNIVIRGDLEVLHESKPAHISGIIGVSGEVKCNNESMASLIESNKEKRLIIMKKK